MPAIAQREDRRRPRADALPEHTHYRDDGCDIHPQCLTCPLPRCRYDEPGGLRALLNAYRDRQIVELRLRGAPVEHLAHRFRLSRRTIFRILERQRGNGNDHRLSASLSAAGADTYRQGREADHA